MRAEGGPAEGGPAEGGPAEGGAAEGGAAEGGAAEGEGAVVRLSAASLSAVPPSAVSPSAVSPSAVPPSAVVPSAASTSDFVFATLQYESGDWDSAPLVPANLIDTLARYTSLRVAPSGVIVALGTEALLQYPFAYMTGHLPVRFTEAERRMLRRWIDRGGFLFVDDHNHDVDGMFHKTCTEELARTLGPLVQLPDDHALYRAFFTFSDGPPTTSHELNGWGDNLVHRHLHAVMRGDRIAVLYSNKDYSSEWGYHPDNKRFQSVDNTRFAVNIVTYALTR